MPDNAEASSSKAPATLGGATLCYTPMINAKLFANAKPGEKQDTDYFDIEAGECCRAFVAFDAWLSLA